MSWRVETILPQLRSYLQGRNVEAARLEAELLLSHVLGCSRTQLYIHPEQPLSEEERHELRALTKRRGQGEPLAYLLGEREFFGHRLVVTPDVLIPRPETEHLVEVALRWVDQQKLEQPRILDVGCGSGAVAIALALALPSAQIVASDLSEAALAVARNNVQRFELQQRVVLMAADVFDACHKGEQHLLETPFDIIVSNPPYICGPQAPGLAPDVRNFEPHLALFGGDDGLDIIRRLCAEAPGHLKSSGLLALEMGYDQARAVGALLGPPWSHKAAVRDLAGHWRIACAWRQAEFLPSQMTLEPQGPKTAVWSQDASSAALELGSDEKSSADEAESTYFHVDEAAQTVRGHHERHRL